MMVLDIGADMIQSVMKVLDARMMEILARLNRAILDAAITSITKTHVTTATPVLNPIYVLRELASVVLRHPMAHPAILVPVEICGL
jgi:hypothetical protein